MSDPSKCSPGRLPQPDIVLSLRNKCHQIDRLTYVSKLNFTQLSQRTHDFSTDLVGDVKLRQGHVRRAEEGILLGRHDGGYSDRTSKQ